MTIHTGNYPLNQTVPQIYDKSDTTAYPIVKRYLGDAPDAERIDWPSALSVFEEHDWMLVHRTENRLVLDKKHPLSPLLGFGLCLFFGILGILALLVLSDRAKEERITIQRLPNNDVKIGTKTVTIQTDDMLYLHLIAESLDFGKWYESACFLGVLVSFMWVVLL